MPFTDPNYTQMPNDLLGDLNQPGLMAEMTLAELKVLLALCRLTFGFHRENVRVSMTKLQKMTGLSRQGVAAGAAKVVEHGLAKKEKGKGINLWIVKRASQVTRLVNEIDQTSQVTRPPSKKEKIKKQNWAKHPAVQVFKEETHYYPGGEWNEEVSKMIGDGQAELSLWQGICHDWIGYGYNPRNVKDMLKAFTAGGIKRNNNGRRKRTGPDGRELDVDGQPIRQWRDVHVEVEKQE